MLSVAEDLRKKLLAARPRPRIRRCRWGPDKREIDEVPSRLGLIKCAKRAMHIKIELGNVSTEDKGLTDAPQAIVRRENRDGQAPEVFRGIEALPVELLRMIFGSVMDIDGPLTAEDALLMAGRPLRMILISKHIRPIAREMYLKTNIFLVAAVDDPIILHSAWQQRRTVSNLLQYSYTIAPLEDGPITPYHMLLPHSECRSEIRRMTLGLAIPKIAETIQSTLDRDDMEHIKLIDWLMPLRELKTLGFTEVHELTVQLHVFEDKAGSPCILRESTKEEFVRWMFDQVSVMDRVARKIEWTFLRL